MSKKLLFAIMAVILCIGLVGGAFSYFTAKVTTNNNVMNAGTIALQISNDNINFTTSTSASINLTNMAPGVPVTTNNIYLKNTGTLPVTVVYAQVKGLTESSLDYTKYIEVLKMGDSPSASYGTWEYSTFDPTNIVDQATIAAFFSYWWTGNTGTYNYAQCVAAGHPYISLWDLQNLAELQAAKPGISFFWYDGIHGVANQPFIGVGTQAAVNFTFQIADNIPTAYNGATSSFNLNLWGASEYNTIDPVSNYLAP
jgi:predicted ribosomally synthesized peptide with SipW-like signal peptide